MTDLISRIKEKPAKMLVKSIVGLTFVGETLRATKDAVETIHEYEPQITNLIGQIGYWPLQVGLPLGELAFVGAIGYIATRGAGMMMDKEWYKEQIQ